MPQFSADPCLTTDLQTTTVVLQNYTEQNYGHLCTQCTDAHFVCCDRCCDTYHSDHIRTPTMRDGSNIGHYCQQCFVEAFAACGICKAEYLVDERLSAHPLGIKVCPTRRPTCSAEAEAETAVDRESPATPEGHREEDAGGNRS